MNRKNANQHIANKFKIITEISLEFHSALEKYNKWWTVKRHINLFLLRNKIKNTSRRTSWLPSLQHLNDKSRTSRQCKHKTLDSPTTDSNTEFLTSHCAAALHSKADAFPVDSRKGVLTERRSRWSAFTVCTDGHFYPTIYHPRTFLAISQTRHHRQTGSWFDAIIIQFW